MAWNRLKSNWKAEDSKKIMPYYLDLISYREISDAIEKEFNVYHESPQVIIIKEGKVIYINSHMGINYNDILSQA
jgi:bacillithiol system protein YtxJ